ncbi:ATP-binding protein [Vibrio owensii]|uniref:AAA family ATPase n=2 Tax=Vibrio owensii TaxID=696485 RepID=UPI000EFAD98E|nr:ATP-binding protein [Vibrio owensii]AYO20308.1 ATP-binding protein [Vibrio owensii]
MNLINHIEKIAIYDGSVYPDSWDLESVNKINFFIGPNNSGKSRKLRELFCSDINNWLMDFKTIPISELFTLINKELENPSNVRFLHNQIRTVDIVKLQEFITKSIDGLIPIDVKNISSFLYYYSKGNSYSTPDESRLSQVLINDVIDLRKENYEEVINFINLNKSKVYIPTLRSLRNIQRSGDNDYFLSRTVEDYFENKSLEKNVFTGHSMYQELVKHLLGSHEQRKKVREYENYLSENFFFGQDISLVPMVEKDVVYFKEGAKIERPIYDLGDGIQSIIILTFKVFMAEKPTVFFIEEPEHYLHAGLQRKLIETFSQHEEHLFFMTTHSNNFLDLAQERSDISIQQVRQVGSETVVQATEKYSDLLNDLGVRASSVLLANCSIWVEGVTDKKYLRAYMVKYIKDLEESSSGEDRNRASRLKSYHENLHYVFTEYQGSNITHWDFGDTNNTQSSKTPAKKLNQNIFLIADADIDGKGNRINVLSDSLGANFHLLERKEIENFIPSNILIKTAEARWETFNRKDNCHIGRFANIKSSLFDDEKKGIGEILERYVTKPKGFDRDFFKDKSGTIKDKVKFCNKATEIMSDPNLSWTLTTELTDLCRKIWDHIEKSNA